VEIKGVCCWWRSSSWVRPSCDICRVGSVAIECWVVGEPRRDLCICRGKGTCGRDRFVVSPESIV
jgi:hypothetical protein